jgi:transposase
MHPGYNIQAVFLCRASIDFRKSIGALSAIVEQEFGMSPFDQALYAFVNRRFDRLKILYWHRNGFCLWYKRLEADKFAWPALDASSLTVTINAREIEWLIEGFDLWAHTPHKTLNYSTTT